MGAPNKAELLKLLQEQRGQLADQQRRLAEQEQEIKLLRQKIDLLSRRLFGKSSEELAPEQLQLLLQMEQLPPGKFSASLEIEEPKEAPATKLKKKRIRAERWPEDLPVIEEVVDPLEVMEQPESWRKIGEEVSEQLDYEPARFLRRRLVRRKYVRKNQVDATPVIAPLPPVLQERCVAAPGLLAQVVVSKYCDHLPLYRQESIFQSRHGVSLSRQNMARWIGLVADWVRPVYDLIRLEVMKGGYVQVDETPIRYLAPGNGSTKSGYLWTSNKPRGAVFYHWDTSRGHECLEEIIPPNFTGTLQSDGYAAYTAFAKKRKGAVELAGCWAHARRKFFEAKEESPQQAGIILRQIQLMYQVEKSLRQGKAGARLRQAVRSAESKSIYFRIGKLLNRWKSNPKYMPSGSLRKAIAYTLDDWKQLGVFLEDGHVEIDNNLVENAIRPTALGKKNWMFFGEARAGERSAILYTLVENCRRLGIDPHEYFRDILTRLPSMTNWQVSELVPSTWLSARQGNAFAEAA